LSDTQREKAERRASKALNRSGFDPEAIDPLYGEVVLKVAVDHLASVLLLQFDDPLPRERTGPITTDELRDRASDREWRCRYPRFRATDATPIAIDPHTDDIPF
jgi:hypothetical protein